MGGAPPAMAVPSTFPFTRRLAQLVPLSPDDVGILSDLQSNTRTVQRHRDIITEGRSYDSFFVIMEGNAIRYRILNDGRRQIINMVLPGDVVGILGSFTDSSLYSTKALTDMLIAVVPIARLNALIGTHTRLIT